MYEQEILLAVHSLLPGNGGISRVARLTAKVLEQEMADGRLSAHAEVFSDPELVADIHLRMRTARGSRIRFLLAVRSAGLSHNKMMFDHLGMARAQSRAPFLRRCFMSWILGREVIADSSRKRIEWAHRADLLVAITKHTRDRAQEMHGGFQSAKVCWLGTETDEIPQLSKKYSSDPTVLVVGRIVEGGGDKGHKEIIDCWDKVVSSVPKARLVIVGSGPGLDYLKTRASKIRSAAQIDFLGFVPECELDRLFLNASVLAMPGRGEGFGLVYIEAMRFSLPVIASVHDAAPEVNVDGETGYNVNLDFPEELPQRLIYLLANPDVALRLGENGLRRWQMNFTYSAFKGRFSPILKGFLEM